MMLWNIKPQTRAYRFTGHESAVLCACFSRSGEIIASASKDCTVKLWIPNIKGDSITFRAHTAAVRWVDLSQDGTRLCTASSDKSVKVWNVQRQKFAYSLNKHVNWVRCCKFSPDSRLILSSSDDKTIRLWDCRNQECVNVFSDTGGFANHIDFHPSETCFASGSSNTTVKVWDLRMRRLIQQYGDHTASVQKVSFHPSGIYLLSASEDCTMKIFDLLEGRPIYTLSGHKGAISAAAFSISGELFASGGADEQVFIWKTNFAEFSESPNCARDSVMASTHVRKSILTERWPLPDIYCSKRYTDDDGNANSNTDQILASNSQRHMDGCIKTAADVESSSFTATEPSKNPSSLPLSSRANQQQEGGDATPAERSAHISIKEKVSSVPECIASTLATMTAQLNILTQAVLIATVFIPGRHIIATPWSVFTAQRGTFLLTRAASHNRAIIES
ncbi:unnamed protein product [Hydatigera taeniaeformis]|uniref:C2H2-type domain-containing protein n=1 Tax=Hydatigena taeniaeformis TaxID=6205 RepID=A0A3P7FF90_HYDTA|nr:unnamed protein product [Hydatigera taeniaeformis]